MRQEWQVARDPASFAAMGFGLGLMPFMPGTFGALLAFPLMWGMRSQSSLAQLSVIAVLSLVGIWLCGRAGLRLGKTDHGSIVWDELCGCALAMLFVPVNWLWWAAAFVVFRFFDILKPWPIGWLDDNVDGGLGVMADDIAAGLAAGVLLFAVAYFLG